MSNGFDDDSTDGDSTVQDAVVVPQERLPKETLRRLIEEFVSREGTDYGAEYSLDQKISHVQRQLDEGSALIVFDPESESVNIIPKEKLRGTL